MAIEIIIREDGAMTANGSPQSTPNSPRGKDEEQGKPKQNQQNLNALLIDYGKQILTQGLNVAIDYSGNTLMQDVVSNVVSIGADALMIIKGGWVGVAAVAMKYATTAITSSIEQDRNKYKVDLIRQSAGMVTEFGGRYTNE